MLSDMAHPTTLKDWIREQGVSKAARKLRVHENTVRNWLNGSNMPQRRMIEKIKRVSGLPASSIYA